MGAQKHAARLPLPQALPQTCLRSAATTSAPAPVTPAPSAPVRSCAPPRPPAQVLALASLLEADNPTPAPARSTLASGTWRLVWSQQAESASALQRWGSRQANSFQVSHAGGEAAGGVVAQWADGDHACPPVCTCAASGHGLVKARAALWAAGSCACDHTGGCARRR